MTNIMKPRITYTTISYIHTKPHHSIHYRDDMQSLWYSMHLLKHYRIIINIRYPIHRNRLNSNEYYNIKWVISFEFPAQKHEGFVNVTWDRTRLKLVAEYQRDVYLPRILRRWFRSNQILYFLSTSGILKTKIKINVFKCCLE